MAETSGQSSGSPPLPSVLPPVAPPPPVERQEAYRPLSLLAILAFVLGVLYSFLVILGGVVAFAVRYPRWLGILVVLALLLGPVLAVLRGDNRFGRLASLSGYSLAVLLTLLGLGGLVAYSGSTLWGLPGTLWFVPVAAVVLALLARSRIQAAEGTLGGEQLARWGLLSSLIFGLIYSAYLTSNTLAIRSQAQACGEEFLESIRKGEILQAFALSIPARNRPSGAQLRSTLETLHNTPRGPNEGGMLSAFTQAAYVRLLQQAGPEARWVLESTNDSFDRGNYQVTLRYRVTTPLAQFTVFIGTIGQEQFSSEAVQRRQWHIDINRTGEDSSLRKPGPEFEQVNRQIDAARRFLNDWVALLRDRKVQGAYLETQPLSEREPLAGAILFEAPAVLAVTGLGPPGAYRADQQARATLQQGLKSFEQGNILDVSDFYADSKLKELILSQVRELFQPKPVRLFDIAMQSAEIPLFKRENGRLQVQFPGRITVIDPTTGTTRPSYRLEFEAVAVGPDRKDVKPMDFQLQTLRLTRGQTPSPEQAPPGS